MTEIKATDPTAYDAEINWESGIAIFEDSQGVVEVPIGTVRAVAKAIEDGPPLKPCMFCGDSRVRTMQNKDAVVPSHYVYCGVCAACGPIKGTEADAVKAWNTRAGT